MCTQYARCAFLVVVSAILWVVSAVTMAGSVRGIYLTQGTLENTAYLTYLIHQAKAVGINTFVIDLEKPSRLYEKNIQLVKENDLDYIARIVVFPDGGKPEQIQSAAYWEKRYALVKSAIRYGADEVQLDYIRYNTKQPASPKNSQNILKVVQWFKEKLTVLKIPLQADVFGIASFGESKHIGQNLQLIATAVDALCPMVYPSHFEPYLVHARTPYQTILTSLKAIQAQFNNKMPVKLYAYIELSNYRYPLSGAKRIAYISAQIKAVKDAGADGWFAWSAHNQYDYLFNILKAENIIQHRNPLQSILEASVESTIDKTTMPISISKNSNPIAWPITARYFIY